MSLLVSLAPLALLLANGCVLLSRDDFDAWKHGHDRPKVDSGMPGETGETGDTDVDLFADATGKKGAYGWIYSSRLLGGYWAGSEPGDPFAMVTFIEPMDFNVKALFGPALDTCAADFVTQVAGMDPWDLQLGEVRLQQGVSAPITLAWNDSTSFYETVLSEGYFVEEQSYRLLADASDPLGALDIEGFFSTPDEPTLLSPDLQGQTLSQLGPSDMTFRWGGAQADWIILEFTIMDNFGILVENTLTCILEDDGEFSVPAAAWPNWTQYQIIHVDIWRVRESNAVLPFNNADVAALGLVRLTGAFGVE